MSTYWGLTNFVMLNINPLSHIHKHSIGLLPSCIRKTYERQSNVKPSIAKNGHSAKQIMSQVLNQLQNDTSDAQGCPI